MLKADDGTAELWYSVTSNKVTFDADDPSVIQTVLQIDRLGRAVRTTKLRNLTDTTRFIS